MKPKHLTKNAMSHKLVFLAVGIAIAIIAAFSICATSQAKAGTNESEGSLIVTYDLDFEVEGLYGVGVFYKQSGEIYDDFEFEKGGNYINRGHDEKNLKNVRYHSYVKPDVAALVITLYVEDEEVPGEVLSSLSFGMYRKNNDKTKNVDSVEGYVNGRIAPHNDTEEYGIIDLTKNNIIKCSDKKQSPLYNISGNVCDEQAGMPVPFANVAYCQYNPWWDMYLPVEGVEPVKTDMGGFYTLEGITEEMLPGKVFVYDEIKQIGESEPIWFFPEDMETLYMWPIVINQEQPDPPVPPTPPDPPVPPGPVPPQPDPPQPVPPTPVPPTPVDLGTNIPQTGDFAGIALAIASMLVLCGACGASVCAKRRKFDK